MTLSGRGLWFGADNGSGGRLLYTEASWTTACAAAAAWGISVLHPKVADGGEIWYSDADLQMLARVAHAFHLKCVPYHWCYGGNLLSIEASVCAHIGSIFDGVSPDIEIQWENPQSASWAVQFGQLVRKVYSGPIYPTSFANPVQHPQIPYIQMNTWATGFLPQVYFSYWTPPTAQNAANYVYPQWVQLDAACRAADKKALAPIYPIICLENAPAQQEIANWLHMMGGYGYCGFWYSALYGSYARTILQAPVPRLASQSIPPEEEVITITISDPHVATFFRGISSSVWLCPSTGKHLQGRILTFYITFGNHGYCGLTYMGLPKTDEINPNVAGHPEIRVQGFDNCSVAYDPHHVLPGAPAAAGEVYLLSVENTPQYTDLINKHIALEQSYNDVVSKKNKLVDTNTQQSATIAALRQELSADTTTLAKLQASAQTDAATITDLQNKLTDAQSRLTALENSTQNAAQLEQDLADLQQKILEITAILHTTQPVTVA
jgi:hypothetical protein